MPESNPVREHWDELAALGHASVLDPADKKGWKNSYLNFLRTKVILDALEPARESLVLDLGCGSGIVTDILDAHGLRVVGSDISLEMLKVGQGVAGAPLVQTEALRLPFRSGAFDAVVTYGVLVYVVNDSDLTLLLREIRRCMGRTGRFVMIEQTTARGRLVEGGLKRQRSSDDYLRILTGAGFKVKTARSIRGGHFPALYLIQAGILRPGSWGTLSRWDGRYSRSKLARLDYVDSMYECVIDEEVNLAR